MILCSRCYCQINLNIKVMKWITSKSNSIDVMSCQDGFVRQSIHVSILDQRVKCVVTAMYSKGKHKKLLITITTVGMKKHSKTISTGVNKKMITLMLYQVTFTTASNWSPISPVIRIWTALPTIHFFEGVFTQQKTWRVSFYPLRQDILKLDMASSQM